MKARYVRCSTDSQNPARQLQKSHPDELLFIDFISGSVALDKRTEGLKMLQAIESGDVDFLTIESIDRLGRSTTDVINRLQYFQDKGITVRVENLGIESKLPDGKDNPVFTLICTVMANISALEKSILSERVTAGIKAAKAAGNKYSGRVKGSVESDDEVLNKYKAVVKVIRKYPNHSLRELAKLCVKPNGKPIAANTVKKVKEILTKQKG